MTKRHPDSARFIWVDAFTAFAAYESARKAGQEVLLDATNIMRNIKKLQEWLGRPLVTEHAAPRLTDFGIEFLDVAVEMYQLSVSAELRDDRTLLRILTDGTVLLDSQPLQGPKSRELANLLLEARAKASPIAEYRRRAEARRNLPTYSS